MFQQVDRRSRWTMVLMLFLMPFLLYGVMHLPIGSASVHQWLPDGKPEKERYTRFQKNFGNDQFLIASWEGCRIDDPRLDEFRSRLISPHAKEPRLIDSVQTTKDILRALTEPPLSISSKQAHSRLEGILIGQDGTAAIMVRFTAYGLEHQAESMVLIYKLADDVPGLGGTALRMAGTVWRVTVKVSALTNDDYGTLTNRVQASVNAVLNESDSNAIALTEFTGLSPVMHETQKMLLKDLGASFTTAFLLLGPLGLCLMPRNGLK